MVSYDEPLPPAGDGEGLEDCGGNQESGEQLCVLLQQEERAHRASVSGAFGLDDRGEMTGDRNLSEFRDDRGQEPVRIYSEVSYEGNRPDFT